MEAQQLLTGSDADAQRLIAALSLEPHPEGGWFREFYRSTDRVAGINGPRSCVTSIYYLLERHQISRWHVVDADEIWHFYRGGVLDLFAYEPSRRQLTAHRLSEDEPAAVIPRGVWQAARVQGDYTLAGCTVAPGFEFADFHFVSDLPDFDRALHPLLTPWADLL